MKIGKTDNISIEKQRDVLVCNGECPNCHSGRHSLILVDFVPHNKPEEGHLYIKCIKCSSLYQTKIKNVSAE